jgi:predicted DNA-binding transcriptional regulator AlpA
MPPAVTPILVSVNDALTMSGMSRSSLYRRLGEGQLEGRKLGSRTMLVADSLRAFIDSAPVVTIKPPKAKTPHPKVH